MRRRFARRRLARRLNEAKDFELHESNFGKGLIKSSKAVVTDLDPAHPDHPANIKDKDKAMQKYEEIKERIAVSYLANVERSRAEARKELWKMMNVAALKIQSMYRCSKAKSFVEDVLLQLHAASVLQGIGESARGAKRRAEKEGRVHSLVANAVLTS